jgi:hypothetical protein
VGSDLIRLLSSQLRVSTEETLGLVALFKGDVGSQFSEIIIKELCNRQRIDKKFMFIIKSLILLCTAKNSTDLISSCKILKLLPFVPLLQLARGLIHPYYIGDEYFGVVGLSPDSRVLKARGKLYG